MRTKILLISLLAGVAFVAGCSTTQAPRLQASDLEITAKVKSKLISDVAPSSIVNVHVNTTNGIVTLAGQVETEQVKQRAEEVAMQVPGVIKVNNDLQIEPSETARRGT